MTPKIFSLNRLLPIAQKIVTNPVEANFTLNSRKIYPSTQSGSKPFRRLGFHFSTSGSIPPSFIVGKSQ